MLLIASHSAFSQGNSLYHSLMLKPKIGHAMAFETAWKVHVSKFHRTDDKRIVYQIISGDNTGYYQLTDGPSSYADMDKINPRKNDHDKDIQMTVLPHIESNLGSNMYRLVDTLSYNPDAIADKYVYTVYNLKQGKMPELMAEIKRAMIVYKNINAPSSYTSLVKLFPGSSPQFVSISKLKDGFKQLELNYFPGMTDKFKENYITTHTQAGWDKRLVLLQEITNSYVSYMVKRRDDLSAK
jgi:hypothetical protein